MNRKHRISRYALLPVVCGAVFAVYLIARDATTDSQAGARIVAQGTTKGAIACARCHGFDAASNGSGAFPALAGQTAYYLSHQLQNFASGQRQNAIMEPIAKGLTPQEMESVAQYYANATPRSIPRTAASPELVARGRQLALVGDAGARVENCVSCHGPNGEGEAPTVPYLAGQYKRYIQVQLLTFKKGYRKAEPMTRIAHNLPEEHIEAIAAYFDQLPLPLNPKNEEETWNKSKTESQSSKRTTPKK